MGVKGDWKRPADPNHAPKHIFEELDMGSTGCKIRGLHVYRGTNSCIYCGKERHEETKDTQH